MRDVAIVGVGKVPANPLTADVSYKELMFIAASKAYDDAGVDPREGVGSFVTCSEDLWEGTSIFDEYVPDQLGGVRRPVCTIPGGGIHGLATAYMQIKSGIASVVALEAHSKSSEVADKERVRLFALDPFHERPHIPSVAALAGMEMRRFLEESGTSRAQVSAVVEKNKRAALTNPYSCYGAEATAESVSASEEVAEPLLSRDIAPFADAACVLVLAERESALDMHEDPVWIQGLGWHNDSHSVARRDMAYPGFMEDSFSKAASAAGLEDPYEDIDLVEVDDTLSYKQLQLLESSGVVDKGEAGALTEDGSLGRDGELPVNPSGGSQGFGDLAEGNGLFRVAEVVDQLRGQADGRRVEDADVGAVLDWRGLPTASGGAVILAN